MLPAVRALRDDLACQLSDGRAGEIVRDGFRIAIVGAPNAGNPWQSVNNKINKIRQAR